MKQSHKQILIWMVFLLTLVLIYRIMVTPNSTAEEMVFSDEEGMTFEA